MSYDAELNVDCITVFIHLHRAEYKKRFVIWVSFELKAKYLIDRIFFANICKWSRDIFEKIANEQQKVLDMAF